MAVNVIAMMTNHDRTVRNALEIFESNKDTSVNCWGFKDIGIETKDAVELVAAMKAAGKTTFLEPLVESEEECLKAAELAVRGKFDYLIGMAFCESAVKLLKFNNIKYFPTCGKRAGIPRMLYGTPESIISDAQRIASYGVDGICLSVYRYADGDPQSMARRFVKEITLPFIISGGINTKECLDFVKSLKPWGFTIGSALFDDSFGSDNYIREKLDSIKNYLAKSSKGSV